MLSIPTVTQILTVIGVALLATTVIVAALVTLISRVRTADTAQPAITPAPLTPAPAGSIPAQRTAAQRPAATTR